MRTNWSTLKEMISAYEQDDLFLSLINKEGRILCANSHMTKTFHLENPRQVSTHFFDLLHPSQHTGFTSAIHTSAQKRSSFAMELYLKNGYYLPMKWEINFLQETCEDIASYLCIGHKLLDDKRSRQFHQLGEKNYQLIVEGMNAGMLFQDQQGELIATNLRTAEILNTTLERIYQLTDIKNLWETTWNIQTENGHPLPFEKTPFIKALQTGKPQTEVLVIRLRNGESRWLNVSSQPLFDEAVDLPFSVVSTITDITQEKILSVQLKEREALFNEFMKQTPTLAWVVDEDSNLVFASRSFYQYFRLDEKQAMNKKIAELIPAVAAGGLYEKHLQVLHTGHPVELVETVKWANGKDFVFHINIFPVEGMTRKRLIGGQAVNLTDKFEAEKQLRETNNRLLLLTGAASNAIWEWDMQTGHIFRNDALMDMIGYHFEEPKGLTWWLRRIHPEDRNRLGDKVKETTEKSLQSWEDEYRFKCADGIYKHMHDKGFVVYENGLPVKMIGCIQDVSGLKELEGQLLEEKLQRQKEISETVIRVQEKERTRIGHELHDNVNQILSTVKLFVDMLTPNGKEEKEVKKKSLDYIMLAIDEIRKLSRELAVPKLSQQGLIPSIITLIDDIHLSTPLKIKFTHDLENDLLTPGKKVTLFRIVQEQLKNILKHSRATQMDIFIQCKDNEARLVIRDNGIGFDPQQTQRGIGLANIYERTRFYNGTVEIETAAGKGCLVKVCLPV